MATEHKPIVVGHDGSPACQRALRWALDEAVIRDCDVHVVNAWVFEPLAEWAQSAETEAIRSGSEALLDEAIKEAVQGRAQTPRIVPRSIEGGPASVLVRAAEHASMLVVASHKGRWLRRALVGSVTNHCVRHATVPVVVVPPEAAPETA